MATLIPALQSLTVDRCADTYGHLQCLHHHDLDLVLGLLVKRQYMCPCQPMMGMHQMK